MRFLESTPAPFLWCWEALCQIDGGIGSSGGGLHQSCPWTGMVSFPFPTLTSKAWLYCSNFFIGLVIFIYSILICKSNCEGFSLYKGNFLPVFLCSLDRYKVYKWLGCCGGECRNFWFHKVTTSSSMGLFSGSLILQPYFCTWMCTTQMASICWRRPTGNLQPIRR